MRFQKGQPRPPNAGRRKGVPNKQKFKKVADALAEQGIDLVTDILDTIANGDLRDKERLDAKLQLLSYCQAKPKESDSDDGESDQDLLDEFEGVSSEEILKLVNPRSRE